MALPPKYSEARLAGVVACALNMDVKTVTAYESPDCVIRVTHSNKNTSRRGGIWCELHIGKPNYAERKFIKSCLESGTRFPVAKFQYKLYPTTKS